MILAYSIMIVLACFILGALLGEGMKRLFKKLIYKL